MEVKEIGVDFPRQITIHTQNSVYTCNAPNVAGQRRIFKGDQFLCDGVIFGIVILPTEIGVYLAEKIEERVIVTHNRFYDDGRMALAIGKIIVGKGVAFDYLPANTVDGTKKGFESLATSDVVKIEVD